MLKRIELKNCKSIKNLDVKIDKLNCIIGKNGVGKTTFIRSLQYFYNSLVGGKNNFLIFDQNNPYNEYAEISLTFDFKYFYNVIKVYKTKLLLGEIKQSRFMEYIEELCSFADSNNCLKIKLLVDKNEEVQWIPNLSFKLRSVIKTIYPFYFISPKNNIQSDSDWGTLWEMIGDMAKLPRFNLEENLEDLLQQNYGTSFSKIIEIIKKNLKIII